MIPATLSLLRAAATGDANLLRGLLAQGTDINSTNAAGQTALMLAAAFGHGEAVSLLLRSGANADLQDEIGLNALDWAANSPQVADLIRNASEQKRLDAMAEEARSEEAPLEEVIEERSAPVSTILNASRQVEKPEIPRPKLGGLAGAILRDHAPRPSAQPPHREAQAIDTARVVPEVTLLETDLPFSAQSSTVEADAQRLKEKTAIVEEHEPSRALVEAPQADEETLSAEPTPLPPVSAETSVDTVVHRERSYSESERLTTPARRKVEVQVPSFTPIHHSGTRPVLWVLIVIFLGAGSYVGYRLSSYFIAGQSGNRAVPAAPNKVPQPAPLAVKAAPVVGGALAGAELFVPDAEYPSDVPSSAQAPVSGNVTVSVQVNQKGVVVKAEAIEGDQRLRTAAEGASRRAAFSPDKLRNKGRLITGTITYSFVGLQNQPTAEKTASTTRETGMSVSSTTGGSLAGTELKLVHPEYPTTAKANKVSGVVTILVRVNRAGRVISWRTLEGDNRLREAALKAAKQSTFSPEKLPGKGEVVGTISYEFRL